MKIFVYSRNLFIVSTSITIFLLYQLTFSQVSHHLNLNPQKLNLKSYLAEDQNNYETIDIENFQKIDEPGKPNLPVKYVNLIIPSKMSVDKTIATKGEVYNITLSNKIFPTQYDTPTGLHSGKREFI